MRYNYYDTWAHALTDYDRTIMPGRQETFAARRDAEPAAQSGTLVTCHPKAVPPVHVSLALRRSIRAL